MVRIQGVEFKRDVVQNHDIARELIAFANLEGGIVLLGVEDNGSTSGITRPEKVLKNGL